MHVRQIQPRDQVATYRKYRNRASGVASRATPLVSNAGTDQERDFAALALVDRFDMKHCEVHGGT